MANLIKMHVKMQNFMTWREREGDMAGSSVCRHTQCPPVAGDSMRPRKKINK